jgi:hypothetical protein
MSTKSRLISGKVPVNANVAPDRYQFLDLSSAEPNLGTSNNGDVLIYNSSSAGGRQWVPQNNIVTSADAKAQAAFDTANTKLATTGGTITGTLTVDGGVGVTGNLSVSHKLTVGNITLPDVIDSQNTRMSVIEGVNLTQNNEITAINNYAVSAYSTANSANDLAQNAYNTANNISNSAQNAYNTANSASSNTIYTQGVDATQNSNITAVNQFAASAYNTANGANGLAQGAYNTANGANGLAQGAYNTANGANGLAAGAYNTANGANGLAQGAYNTANGANGMAVGAYAAANNKLNLSGGTITGTLIVDGQANVYQKLTVGTGAYQVLPNLIAQFTGTSDEYIQVNMQNLSANGSGDFVVTADIGTDAAYYVDLGKASSNYAVEGPTGIIKPLDSFLIAQGNDGTQPGSNLIIAAATATYGDISFVQGGLDESNEVARFIKDEGLLIKLSRDSINNSTGSLVVQGGLGVQGNVYSGNVFVNGLNVLTYTQAAFDKANTGGASGIDQYARDTANLAIGIDGTQNTRMSVTEGVDLWQNNQITYVNQFAQSAYDKANTGGASGVDQYARDTANLAIGIDATQNTRLNSIETINIDQNTSISIIQGVDLWQNNEITAVNQFAAGAYSTANGANGLAVSAYNTANGANGLAQGAFNTANGANGLAQGAYNTANGANGLAADAYNQANTNATNIIAVNEFAASAYNTANGANGMAVGAYAAANNKLNLSGGTITGNLNVQGANVSLGIASNVHIYGGNTGQLLTTDGTGNIEWIDLPTPNTVTYTANSLIQTNGVYVSGNLWSTQVFGDYNLANGAYILTDGSGSAPAWYINFDFINVEKFNRVVANINYTQNSGHTVYIQLYNYNTTTWDNIGTYSGLGSYYAFALEVIDETSYVSAGIVQLRLYHSNGGSVSHQTSIDYIALEQSYQGPQGPRGPTGATGATGATGPGVASGGTAGQVLIKNSSTNYDTAWSNNLIDTNAFAQSAYDAANNKLNLSGGTLTGPLTISANSDLLVTGNLTVLGNTLSIGTQTLEVADPMIILGIGNYTTDIVDIGFAGHYNDGSNAHTGLIRDAGTKDWYLFQGYTPELSGNNNVNINDTSFATANLIVKKVTGNIVATTAVVNGRELGTYTQSAYDTANGANGLAAGAYDTANGANGLAAGAYDTANGANGLAQGAYNTANGANGLAQGSYNTANGANGLAQGAFNTANGANGLASGAYNQANTNSTNISVIQGVDVTQNTRLDSIETVNTNQNTSISIIQGVDNTQNTQISGIQGVDLAQNSAISITQGVDLWQNSQITYVNQFAQSAYDKANTGGASGVDQYARDTANLSLGIDATQNTRLNSIETVNNNQNTSINIIQGVDLWQNNQITYVNQFAQAAFNQANTGGGGGSGIDQYARDTANLSIGIDATQNTRLNSIETINNNQNTSITVIQGVDLWQNSQITYVNQFAQAAFEQANTGGVTRLTSNSTSRITQNTTTGHVAIDLASSGVVAGTYSYPQLDVDAYGRVTNISTQTPVVSFNTRTGAVSLTANDVINALNYVPFGTANNVIDQFARDTANSKLSTSGGTVTGTLTVQGDFGVQGNLTVSNISVVNTLEAQNTTIINLQAVDVYQNTAIQAAYDKANSANILAQAAYNYANTISGGGGSTIDQFARDTANGAGSLAQSAYNYANTIQSGTVITSNTSLSMNVLTANAVVITGPGNTLTLDGSNTLSIISYSETLNTPAIISNTITIDLSKASVFNVALTAASSVSILNPAPSGRVTSFVLVLEYSGIAYSVTWPASVRWQNAVAPTLTGTNGKRDVFTFFTYDGGTSYNAAISSQNI